MGSAPKWCAFLENLTEEMEESKDTVLYEDYKFLTPNDLQQLNATHLIGTPMLKAYMHGYFIEMRAYQKLLSVSDPFAYEKYRKEQINEKLNALREKRIQVTK
jgi:ribosome biogenesis protein ENP2